MTSFFTESRLEGRVAVHAPTEQALKGVQVIGTDDLQELLTEVVALDEKPLRLTGRRGKGYVPGQHDSLVAPGNRQETAVV